MCVERLYWQGVLAGCAERAGWRVGGRLLTQWGSALLVSETMISRAFLNEMSFTAEAEAAVVL